MKNFPSAFRTKNILFLVVLVVSLFLFYAFTAGPRNPASFAEIAYGTESWTDLSEAGAPDDVYATSDLEDGEYSTYIYASNFGFTIPSGNVITGIEVTVNVKGKQVT